VLELIPRSENATPDRQPVISGLEIRRTDPK
jgi:hypothetical protein